MIFSLFSETSPIEAFLEGKEPQRCRCRASVKTATIRERQHRYAVARPEAAGMPYKERKRPETVFRREKREEDRDGYILCRVLC